MLKQEFIKKYRISDAIPTDPSDKAIPANAFIEAIEEYLNDHFRGVARVNGCSCEGNPILIVPEYAAFFFKLLLTSIHGRSFIDIRTSSYDEMLILSVRSDEPLPLDDDELRMIIKAARNAGFHIMPNECEIRLTLYYSDAVGRALYAISVFDGKAIMLREFNRIFHYPKENL